MAKKAENQLTLVQLHWCGKPLMVFRDEGAAGFAVPGGIVPSISPTPIHAPLTLKEWAQVKPLLTFHLYLPASLPTGTCLMSAYGTVHDPILESSFTIAYLLPDHSPLSLSEAPLHSNRTNLQCSSIVMAAGTQSAVVATESSPDLPQMQICSGARNTTAIIFSAQWSNELLRTFFRDLQEDNEWQPLAERVAGDALDAHSVL